MEKSARIPIDDTSRFMKALSSGHDIVALVAPSAHSNFDVPKMITGLKHLGVKAVYDVAWARKWWLRVTMKPSLPVRPNYL